MTYLNSDVEVLSTDGAFMVGLSCAVTHKSKSTLGLFDKVVWATAALVFS